MSDTIVCLHGAFAGGWCFERFERVFREAGLACHAPDLPGHGTRMAAGEDLTGLGCAEYRAELAGYLGRFDTPPVLLGHSMGAILAQQLAAQGLASALVLVGPAPRAGILPSTESERQAAKGLMFLGPFWDTVVHPHFEVAEADSLNRLPEAERRPVFDRFGPESGRALFELFFWMLDGTGATRVDCEAIRCPILCLSGSEDRVVSPATARAIAAALPRAEFREIAGAGHMLPVEPGADAVAAEIAAWIAGLRPQA
jgi:pimeloyl-ACP methyl ester carboxylesterase